jgi:hypothetical protein
MIKFFLLHKQAFAWSTFAAAVVRPYLSNAGDVILSLIASLSAMLDRRYQEILAIIS